MMRKVYAVLICMVCIFAVSVCAFAESTDKSPEQRTGISILESAQIWKNADGSYSTGYNETQEELVLTGTYDGNGRLMVILNSVGGDIFGCTIEKSTDGNWKCTIPTSALYKNETNKLVVVYYDDFSNETVCYINCDMMCELELDAVFENQSIVSGTTEPGSDVKLVWADGTDSVVADENGRFSIEADFDLFGDGTDCYIEVTDLFGNVARQNIVIIDVDISVYVDSVCTTEAAHIVVTAIPDSHVQILFNGESIGETVKIDDLGNGSADIYGIEHGAHYSVTAVYAGEYDSFDVVSAPVWFSVDTRGPKITADDIVIDEKTTEINIHTEEEATLVFTEETTGYSETLHVVPGKNKISFAGLAEAHEIVAGMRIAFIAFDEYGNESAEEVVFDVQLPVSDMLFIAGMATDGNKVNAMEEAKVVGQVYVHDKDYSLDAYIYGYDSNMAQIMEAPSYSIKLNSEPLKAYESDKAAKMPAFIPINMMFDAEVLPMDYSYELVFHIYDANGERLYSYNRLNLGFSLEKDSEWLFHRLILMGLLAICFMIVLYLYILISRRRRSLKRNNGAVRHGRNVGKRGGVWA